MSRPNDSHAENELVRKVFEAAGDKILSVRQKIAKNELEVHRQRVKLNKETFAERREVVRSIPKFWESVLIKSPELSRLLDPKDLDALEHLTDIHVDFSDNDPREFTISFSFSSKNPYFSDTTLSKKYTLVALPAGIAPDSREALSLDRPLESTPVSINWTSEKHNLVKLRPRTDPNSLEEYDDFSSALGSIFNLFSETDDPLGIADALLQSWAEAHDIYAGLVVESDDEDDEEDEEDGAGSIELGDEEDEEEEKPAKKKRRTKS